MLMANYMANIIDIKGAFLLGRFNKGEELFMEISQGFEKYFSENEVIKLLVPFYGLKQASRAFYKELVAAARHMNMERNKIDPCVFFKWIPKNGVRFLASWIDDLMNIGDSESVADLKNNLNNLFDCSDEGEMTDYIGCKIDRDRNDRSLKMTQPVLIQSFTDEFKLPNKTPNTPMLARHITKRGEEKDLISHAEQKICRSEHRKNVAYSTMVQT